MKVKQYRKILLLVLMICAAILFGCVERALGRQLSTQQIASEWSAEDSYAQISCFFSKDAAVTKDYVIQLEQKLKTALQEASTGGFTDCLLQKGAKKVFAIDVGYGQLAWALRTDPRVVCMERTNIRYVVPEDIEERPSFVSIDVSFISLTKVLLPVRNLMEENGEIAALIKPQFEAGREKVGKKGVVRDPAVHKEVIEMVISYAKSISFGVRHLEFSPIKGPEGNIEYLVHLVRLPDGVTEEETNVDVDAVVKSAHDTLDK